MGPSERGQCDRHWVRAGRDGHEDDTEGQDRNSGDSEKFHVDDTQKNDCFLVMCFESILSEVNSPLY